MSQNIIWRGKKTSGRKLAYLSIRVPSDVAAAYGKEFVRESLKTSEPHEAKRLAAHRLAQLHDEWKAIREHKLTPDDFRRIGAQFYARELERDRKRRATYADAVETETLGEAISRGANHSDMLDDAEFAFLESIIKPLEEADDRLETLAALRGGLRNGRPALLADLSEKLVIESRRAIVEAKLPITDTMPEFREVKDTVRRAMIAGLETAIERDAGNFGHKPLDEIVQPPTPSTKVAKDKNGTIMAQWAIYERSNPNGVAVDTLTYSRRAIESFAESLPANFAASAIDKAAVREWHDLLEQLPVKASEITDFKGLKIREIVEANRLRETPKPAISAKTINKSLSALGSFCTWLIRRGILNSENPVAGFYHAKPESIVRAYSADELNRFFRSPIFTGYRGDEKEAHNSQPGNVVASDHRRWLPLLSLFTGARLGELAQLQPEDIRQEHGRWIMFVTTEGEHKRLKTSNSQRILPLHAQLIELGLADYVKAAKDRQDKSLFPALTRDDQDRIAGEYSRWFGRYCQRIGLKKDKTLNFHSFRHTFIDACRSADFLDTEYGFVVGHAKQEGKTTRGYGSISEGTIKRACEIIDAVKFDGLDLTHL